MKKALQLIDQDLTKFEDYFREAVKSNAPLLDRIMQYIVKRKGKQMRPMFVLLSAKLGGKVNESTYRAASLVELVHRHAGTRRCGGRFDGKKGFFFCKCTLEKQDRHPGRRLPAVKRLIIITYQPRLP